MTSTDLTQFDSGSRRYVRLAALFLLINAAGMLYRYGHLPIAPVQGDEIIINDAAISLAKGHGYAATSFPGSPYGIDHLFAHFPPLYPLTESLAIRAFGVSVYSLRLTTTVMSLAASIVLLALLYFLGKAKVLDWTAATLVAALYCTCGPLIIAERMARMESMVALLVHLAFASVMVAAVMARDRLGSSNLVSCSIVVGGLFAGLAFSVHSEAVSAVFLLAPLVLLAVPGYRWSKAASALLLIVVPAAVWLATFRSRSFLALHQFRAILHSATPNDPSVGTWWRDRSVDGGVAALNRDAIFVLILALVVVQLIWFALRCSGNAPQYRLARGFAVASVLELITMEWILHVNPLRYQFLYGPLLIGVALTVFGGERVRPAWRNVAWVATAFQLTVVAVYLSPARARTRDTNPDRFMPIIRSLPPNATVAAAPNFWLDFQEMGRPITVIYGGYDGRHASRSQSENPLDPFDAVLVVENDSVTASMRRLLAAGRRRVGYRVGEEIVGVYLREPVTGQFR